MLDGNILRGIIIGSSLVIIIGVAAVAGIYGRTAPGNIGYTGAKACGECHGEEAIGNQNKIWGGSPHAKAYLALKSARGAGIAAPLGIKDPAGSRECLRCHTTGGGEHPSVAQEGVGCEACHGPGEKYHTASGHVDYSSRENGYRKAVKLGMYPILGITSLKYREKLCLSCHTEKRPCYDKDTRDRYKYRIPIQTVDSLMKDDVNFRHPLRR